MNEQMMEDINLQALGLFDDGETPVNVAELAEEFSTLPKELPQPGVLRLRIPGSLQATDFKQVGDSSGAKRLQVLFRDDLALQIQPSGAPLNYNLTDFRNTTRDGEIMGEFLSFIRGTGYKGSLEGKADMIRATLAARGKDFMADLTYTAKCNPKRAAWSGGKELGQAGCGQIYEMKAKSYVRKKDQITVNIKQIPRGVDGTWLVSFSCSTEGCGADVRCFPKLSNYREAR